MLVATKTFTTSDRWHGEFLVVAGKDRVSEDSPIALEHPDWFEPVAGTRRGGRERIAVMADTPTLIPVPTSTRPPRSTALTTKSSTPAKPPGVVFGKSRRPRWMLTGPSKTLPLRECVLRGGPAAQTIRLGGVARADLLDAVRAAGDVETGGLLFSASRPWRSEIRLVAVSGPGPDARHEPGRYIADVTHDLDRIRAMRRYRDLVCVGAWHSHPGGTTRPSDADLVHWSSVRALVDVDALVGLIVAGDPSAGWVHAKFVPHVIRPGASSRSADIAERSTLVES